ncbi:hypothetical protein SAMN05216214_12213 [Atopomonas hussainii]|uniref:Uncharacterized protein n=1 Tax=Atopomonas hussainii TaxID=1429083 RepID=A0A1H7T2I3_9GAMM|nr:hypothetical protein [Atopomonas hussainii]SEL78709.1 hypothetical protein SAMN05216214_12213 [Atopomonas hussainii]
MSVHQQAQELCRAAAAQAQAASSDEQLLARALLSAVVQWNKQLRSASDLAAELEFLANNLDDEQDYLFMRP